VRKQGSYSAGDRLAALGVAVLFAVPTAFVAWFAVNLELAPVGGFLSSFWLWGTIILFALMSAVSPNVFVSLLGALWQGLYRLARWFQ
jgi:hypothetical protein